MSFACTAMRFSPATQPTFHPPVHGGGFSLPFGLEEDGGFPFPTGAQTLVRAVVAAIRHPHDVQFLLGIVQFEGVRHLFVYDVRFVEGGDEKGHFGQIPVCCRQHASHGLHEKLFELDEQAEHDAIA